MAEPCAGCGCKDVERNGWYLHVKDVGKVCDARCWELAKLKPPPQPEKPEGWVWPWNN